MFGQGEFITAPRMFSQYSFIPPNQTNQRNVALSHVNLPSMQGNNACCPTLNYTNKVTSWVHCYWLFSLTGSFSRVEEIYSCNAIQFSDEAITILESLPEAPTSWSQIFFWECLLNNDIGNWTHNDSKWKISLKYL